MNEQRCDGNTLVSLFNGYGDAFLALPALSAFARHTSDRVVYLACPPDQHRLFFRALPLSLLPELPADDETCGALLDQLGVAHFVSYNAYFPSRFDQRVQRTRPDLSSRGFCDKEGQPVLTEAQQRDHMRDQYFHVVGLSPSYALTDRQPPLTPEAEGQIREWISQQAPALSPNCYVLHLDTEREKMWPIERWCAVVEQLWLQRRAWPIVIGLDTPDGQALLARCPVARRLAAEESMERAIAAIKLAPCFLGVDSIFAHIADSYHKPMLVLFGASNPVVWGPRGPLALPVISPGGGMAGIMVETVIKGSDELAFPC